MPPYARLLDAHPQAAFLCDLEGRLVYVNAVGKRLIGSDAEGLADLTTLSGTALEDMLGRLAGGSAWSATSLTLDTGPHAGVRVALRARGIRNDSGRPLAYFVADASAPRQFAEHTELVAKLNAEVQRQRQLRDQLDRALEAEQHLHRELIHRVKNNLTLLSVLVRSRRSASRDPAVAQALTDIDNRIRAIALVHDLLDRHQQTEIVDAGTLLGGLCALMEEAICPPGVTIRHEVAPLRLHISDATPLCLLINELVTNSVKHAFGDSGSGSIELRFEKNGVDKFELYFADSGASRIEEASARDGEGGQGHRTVEALARQLGGTLERAPGDGVAWNLVFPPSHDTLRVSSEARVGQEA